MQCARPFMTGTHLLIELQDQAHDLLVLVVAAYGGGDKGTKGPMGMLGALGVGREPLPR